LEKSRSQGLFWVKKQVWIVFREQKYSQTSKIRLVSFDLPNCFIVLVFFTAKGKNVALNSLILAWFVSHRKS
jgi:hypothetical protein